jgi:hypothetical protein
VSAGRKLVTRFKEQSKDFTFDELVTLLKGLGFMIGNKRTTVIFPKK